MGQRTCCLGILTGLLAISVAGCASAVETGKPASPPTPVQPEVPVNPTLESVTATVLQDAAQRTGIDTADLTVESARPVTWGDGSLGCPEPGMSYTQALVPGYRIRIKAGEQLLDYHASRTGYFVLCPPGRGVDPLPDQSA